MCAHRSGVRIRPLDSRLFKKWPDLRSGRRSIFFLGDFCCYTGMFLFSFFFFCFVLTLKLVHDFNLRMCVCSEVPRRMGEYLSR